MDIVGFAHEIGFVLLGGVFVFAGTEHFVKFAPVVERLKAQGVPAPAPLLAAGSVLETVAGLGVAIDIWRVPCALALAAFTIAASVMVLDFWRFAGQQREAMRANFLVNVAVLGGLVIAATS